MESYTPQFIVTSKSEAMTDGLKFTVNLAADVSDVSGEIRIVVSDPDVRELFTTNGVFDVVITPHVEAEPE